MAKTQTFGDKVNKKKGDDKQVVKVLKAFKGNDGAFRFDEKFVKVEPNSNLEKLEIK